MTTAEDIIELAYARLGDVVLGEIASPAELLNLLNAALSGVFQFGAALNPAFFMVEHNQAPVANAWPRPGSTGSTATHTAISVLRIELSTGVEVVVVPFDRRDIEPGSPAVYEIGQIFKTAGNPLDPATTETLRFFFARFPTQVVLVTDVVDAMWPEEFNMLLALELAMYIALKNKSTTPVDTLRGFRDEWAERFATFIERATMNLTRSRSVGRGSRAAARAFLAGNQAQVAA